MKLNLGCGHNYMEGWINVDGPKGELCYDDVKADIHARIEDLEYANNSVDEIFLKAVFEHFPRHIAIMQLRRFYKWLKPGGELTIVVPDFWGTVKMLKESESVEEQQFWFRHLYGPQDTIQFGTHYDAFDIKKLRRMFSIVGFNEHRYVIIKRWPSIRFTGIKDDEVKSDGDAERDIIRYIANYETRDEHGLAFGAWIKAMGLKCDKPPISTFKTHEMYKSASFTEKAVARLRHLFL